MGKTQRLAKARQASKKMKNQTTARTHKIRTKIRFYKPKTRSTKSTPSTLKSLKSEIKKRNYEGLDYARVLIQPVSSDKNLMNMENNNTIAFLVSQYAKKCQIKEAFEKTYGYKVRKINTLNTIGRPKKAYIRLANEGEALNVASKIGIL